MYLSILKSCISVSLRCAMEHNPHSTHHHFLYFIIFEFISCYKTFPGSCVATKHFKPTISASQMSSCRPSDYSTSSSLLKQKMAAGSEPRHPSGRLKRRAKFLAPVVSVLALVLIVDRSIFHSLFFSFLCLSFSV